MKKVVDSEGNKALFFFTDGLCVNFNSYTLLDNNEEVAKFTGQEGVLLKLLVDNANIVVTQEKIFSELWGFSEAGGPTDVNQAIRGLVSRIKKKNEFFRDNIEKGIEPGSWKIRVDRKYVERYKREYGNTDYELIGDITCSNIQGLSKENLLFRERELSEIRTRLKQGKKVIVLSGMGGVGKTSIVRLLFEELKAQYDCYGWINYSIDLKQSFIKDLRIDDEKFNSIPDDKTDKKWVYIRKLINNSKEKKLFVIDNVDYVYGESFVQDPTKDIDLLGLSGWDNATFIITTRLPYLEGLSDICKIENLGSKRDVTKCLELFYHYNKTMARDRDMNEKVVEKLCALAGYNTMVIELLSKACKYENPDLEDFYKGLLHKHFKYVDDVPVSTEHDLTKIADSGKPFYNLGEETAASQLQKLFYLGHRSDTERLILWDFANIPEAERVSKAELKEWMGFSIRELNKLVDEGWIKSDGGFFYVHPLVRQTIICDDTEIEYYLEKAQERRAVKKDIVSLLFDGRLFSKEDPFRTNVRKLVFVDGLTYGGKALSVKDLLYVADFARKIGIRPIALEYYEKAYRNIQTTDDKEADYDYLLWKSTYFYGYVLSYSMAGYEKAEELVRKSLNLAKESINAKQPTDEDMKNLSMSYDHLGYIICRRADNQIDRISEADYCLNCAVKIRQKLAMEHPDDNKMLHDYAWSLDNLGSMYADIDPDKIDYSCKKTGKKYHILSYEEVVRERKAAIESIKIALEIRRKLGDLTEIAWTLHYLAKILSSDPTKTDEVKQALEESILIHQKLNEEFPDQHIGSEAAVCLTYARFLRSIGDNPQVIEDLLNRSLSLNRKLEEDFPGVYTREILNVESEIREFNKIL